MKSDFEAVPFEKVSFNAFEKIGKDWMLVAAEKDDKINAMTAAWGGVGIMWGMDVAFIFIRESRYTKEFIDGSDHFSLMTFDTSKFRNMLSYMGKVSGRDEDKIKKMGLTVEHIDGVPFFKEAAYAVICRKLFCQLIDPENIPKDICDAFYSNKDYHYMYVGKIERVFRNNSS